MTIDRSNDDRHGETLVRYWLEKAGESLESARSEYEAGRFSFAVNRFIMPVFMVLVLFCGTEAKNSRNIKGFVALCIGTWLKMEY